MAMQTHYEVHVQQAGRWSIHAQFDSSQRDQAIEEAKQLDSHGVGAVKVIREVYDTSEGTHRDYVIYKSQGAAASDGEKRVTLPRPAPVRDLQSGRLIGTEVRSFTLTLIQGETRLFVLGN